MILFEKSLIILFLLTSFANAQENDLEFKHSNFFKTKLSVKENIVETIKLNYHGEVSKSLQEIITYQLKQKMNQLIEGGDNFKFQIVSHLDEYNMVFTLVVQYEDQLGFIVWEFHVLCSQNKVIFLSRNAETEATNSDDYYAWLRLERQ